MGARHRANLRGWHTTVASVHHLKQLAIAQLESLSGDERLRYSLEYTTVATGRQRAALTRTYRRPLSLGGGTVTEEIEPDPAFAARLRDV